MKIFITGAHGQVGSSLAAELERCCEHEYLAVGQDQLELTRHEDLTTAILDFSPQVIINAAAYTSVDDAEKEKGLVYAVNRDVPRVMAQICQQQNIVLIHLTTDYVFSGDKDGPYAEDDDARPLSVYGQSKWEGEEAVRENLGSHLILRLSWVFSAVGNNFVKTILGMCKREESLRIVSDQQGCPTSATDIAIAIKTIARKIQSGHNISWGTYHFAGQPPTNWFLFAKSIVEIGKEIGWCNDVNIQAITAADYPTVAQRPRHSVLNCKKFEQMFGLKMPEWKKSLTAVIHKICNA